MAKRPNTLTRLDIYLAVDETRRRAALVDKLARELGYERKGATDPLVEGEFSLAKNVSATGRFHIDRVLPSKDDPSPLLFAHLNVRAPKPSTKRAGKAKTAAFTLDRLTETVSALAERNAFVSTDARLAIAASARRRPTLAPPILVGAQVMQSCGAEYRAQQAGPVGLRTFRWSEHPNKIDVWLSYTWLWEPSADLWQREEARCLHFVSQML